MADVVGHGVAAALSHGEALHGNSFALISEPTAAQAITRLNERLCQQQTQRFVTMVALVIDPTTSVVQIVCAGHMPPIRRLVNGAIQEPGEETGWFAAGHHR